MLLFRALVVDRDPSLKCIAIFQNGKKIPAGPEIPAGPNWSRSVSDLPTAQAHCNKRDCLDNNFEKNHWVSRILEARSERNLVSCTET